MYNSYMTLYDKSWEEIWSFYLIM